MYLSSKNITFAKGLARKLIPKFIGPYKILRDYQNSSFQPELPPHLKRRGVHDVFHSSLLREHIPNDDRLFPRRMDTQIGNTPETEGEWAVDRILLHSGSKTNAVFEIRWKSGDTTWLPYYQITHLQALTEYLDLLGEPNIHKLSKGTGKPPQEDPQLFLGAISLDSALFLNSKNPKPNAYKNQPYPLLPDSIDILSPSKQQHFHPTTTTIVTNLSSDMRNHRRSTPRGLSHPLFTRISPTTYLIKDLAYPVYSTVHIAQIAEYLQFDEELRAYSDTADFTSFPVGYIEFSKAWNEGTYQNDPRHFSTIFLEDDPNCNSVTPSTHPLRLEDFEITPSQLGTVPDNPRPSDPLQDDITREFAAVVVMQRKKQRQYAEERRQKRLNAGYIPNAARNHTVFKNRNRKRVKKHETSHTGTPSPDPQHAALTEIQQPPAAPEVAEEAEDLTQLVNANPELTTPMEIAT